MTSTTSGLELTGSYEGEIFKRDTMGRVRVPRARREALLDEFERNGGSGAQFAAYVGIKYSTLANWIQSRRKKKESARALDDRRNDLVSGCRQWVEAIVDNSGQSKTIEKLTVYLPGGARVELTHAGQAALAAILLKDLLMSGSGR